MNDPTFDDIAAAARRIADRVWRTPVLRSDWLSSLTGAEVWLKLETAQASGAFKVRGAFNALARLRECSPGTTTVTTASAGNHGLALAMAGAALGVRVRVHLPATAPDVKKRGLARYGAVVIEAADYDAAEQNAREEIAKGDITFVSAYSHPDVIAGAGTAALELIESVPGLDALVAPLGGGGLLSGTALVARARLQDALVAGAEAEASPVFTAALAAGKPVTVAVRETVADGLAGNMEPDSRTFVLVRDLVDRVVAVPEPDVRAAMKELAERECLVAEGAAAAAAGALAAGLLDLRGRRVGLILSGRNRALQYAHV